MTISRRSALVVALALLFGLAGGPTLRAQLATFTKSELTIESASGKHRFSVEEAQTPQQMAQGLMFRRAMAADAGMLFEFDTPQIPSFWRNNTFLTPDMLS